MDADKDLVLRCINKDKKAQEHFYRRFSPRLYGICLRYTGNPMEAEDILQEGFIRLFSNLHRFRFEGSLEGWTVKIMINTAINYLKRNKKFSTEVELDHNPSVATLSEDGLSKLSRDDILKIIQSLPTGYRTVFNLYIMDGYSHQEIADMLNISESTSKSQLSRARATLQHRLAILLKDR